VGVDQHAYCDSIDKSNVVGQLFCNTVTATTPNPATGPGPLDQPTTTLPISDAKIEEWKLDAANGGVILSTDPECSSGTYTIDSATTLGPIKIECNLLVDKGSTVLTLAGPVWITGNLDTKSSPTIRVDPALPNKSIQLILDNPSNRLTSSKALLDQGATFTGSAGNSGPFNNTKSQPSVGEFVTSVAAAAKSLDDGEPEISFYSSVGPAYDRRFSRTRYRRRR